MHEGTAGERNAVSKVPLIAKRCDTSGVRGERDRLSYVRLVGTCTDRSGWETRDRNLCGALCSLRSAVRDTEGCCIDVCRTVGMRDSHAAGDGAAITEIPRTAQRAASRSGTSERDGLTHVT